MFTEVKGKRNGKEMRVGWKGLGKHIDSSGIVDVQPHLVKCCCGETRA